MRGLTVATAAVALLAAACSADSGSSDPPATSAPPASTTVATTTTIAPSGGCGARPDDVAENGFVQRTIESHGDERQFAAYVPESYTGDEPVALVYTFHGAGSNKEQQLAYSAFGPSADRDGTIVVGPDGLGEPRRWSPYGRLGEAADLEFFDDLHEAVLAEFCIDASRVYAAGMSSGGFMTASLACARGEVFAAVAPVTATVYTEEGCASAPPMPYLYFHGTDDPVVPFLGPLPHGDQPGPGSAEVSSQGWADHNGCDPDPVDETIGVDIIHRTWTGCEAETHLYIVEGGGHTWPGGLHLPEAAFGATTDTISATRLIWELFAANPASD